MGNPYDRMVTDLMLEAEEGITSDDDEAVISFLSEGKSEEFGDDDEIDDILDEEEEL